MVTALVVTGCREYETVRSYILRVVQLDVVGTLDGGNIGEGTLGSATGHTGHLLINSVGISGHQAQPVHGTGIHGYVGNPTITTAGVLQNEGLGTTTETGGEDGTVVHTIEAGITTHARHAPVTDAGSIDVAVEDTLNSHAEGEGNGDVVVNSQRGLPYHRHLELGIYSRD